MSLPPDASTTRLIQLMDQGYDDFTAYLNTLTPEQLTVPTDAAGWTAKDHIAHLAVWEDGMTGLLEGQERGERMGLDLATWEADEINAINDNIYRRVKDLPLDQVMSKFEESHRGLVARLRSEPDDFIAKPYGDFIGEPSVGKPVLAYLVGNSFEHYNEHRPWIEAIVRSA